MGCEKTVAGLRTGDDGSNWNILVMKHQVLNEETFTGITTPDEHDNGALIFIGAKADGLHIEFREF